MNRAVQNEMPWNELTHDTQHSTLDTDPEGYQTSKINILGSPRHVLFPANG